MVGKHENTLAELDKPYEPNSIGLRGIIYFAIGLVILILVTFGLMWALLGVLKDQTVESGGPTSPMAMNDRESLPPEPRLQAAPGFKVDLPSGRVNLELMAPQSEYRSVRKEWDNIILRGQKDEKTGTMISIPIAEAKEKLLSEGVKVMPNADAENILINSRMFISDSSAGRLASEKRR